MEDTALTLSSNVTRLAALSAVRYALVCQDVGLVPIVEPDVSMTGTHSLEAAVAINTKIQVRPGCLRWLT